MCCNKLISKFPIPCCKQTDFACHQIKKKKTTKFTFITYFVKISKLLNRFIAYLITKNIKN